MADEEEEINKPPRKQRDKDLRELDDIKAASETKTRGCRIHNSFSGKISWSSLELESLLEPQMATDENPTASNGHPEKLLAESEKVVERLKAEIQRHKDSEKRLYDLLATQTLQLEQAHICIDKWKDMMGWAEGRRPGMSSHDENSWLRLQVERLEKELGILRKGQNPWEEVMRLRKELEQAIEAEGNSKRAMDDLALVIKEVAAEANQAKDKLATMEQQLGIMKEEADNWKSMINIKEKAHQLALAKAKSAEERGRAALGEAHEEIKSLKATVDRLRAELKGSLPEKEAALVDSVKRNEEEKAKMQEEKKRLVESLNEAKDEARQTREILKQAKVEIAQLKESLALTQDPSLKKQIPCQPRKESKAEEKERPKGDLKGRWRSTGDLKSCAKSSGLPSSKRKEEHQADEGLGDSIFDLAQPAGAKFHHTRSASDITFSDDASSATSDEADSFDKGSNPKKKVLLRRFSELWKKKGHSRSNSHGRSSQAQSHNHNQNPKEVAIH